MDDAILLRGASVILPHGVFEATDLLVARGRIMRILPPERARDVRAAREIDLTGATIFPGFNDVHIHGAVGVDTMAASADDLHRVARFLSTEGVTAWLPTLVPAPESDYRAAVESITQLMREQDERPRAARALGVHYEGPFVNREQCGALRAPFFRTFKDVSDVETLPTLDVEGAAHMITVAPEIEGGVELVRELKARGWVVSIGHTRAGLETLDRAAAAGARHMTHFFNAMSPLHQRTPGPAGWGLLRDDVTCDIIADGHHVAPLVLQLALRCKTPERLLLISDAVAPAGEGDGEFRIWGETIKVTDGRTENERGSIAGSVSTMRDAVGQMLALGVAPSDVARMASANPARLLGVDESCGTIEEGKRADLVALDADGRVRLTLIGGRVAFDGTTGGEGR